MEETWRVVSLRSFSSRFWPPSSKYRLTSSYSLFLFCTEMHLFANGLRDGVDAEGFEPDDEDQLFDNHVPRVPQIQAATGPKMITNLDEDPRLKDLITSYWKVVGGIKLADCSSCNRRWFDVPKLPKGIVSRRSRS